MLNECLLVTIILPISVICQLSKNLKMVSAIKEELLIEEFRINENTKGETENLTRNPYDSAIKDELIAEEFMIKVEPIDENSPLECQICYKMLPSVEFFNDHLKIHEVMHQCTQCGTSFFEFDYVKHMFAHKGIYDCIYCSHSSEDVGDIEVHLKIHVRDKRLKCALCENVFKNRHSVRVHLRRVHNYFKKKSKYSCEVCNVECLNDRDLMEHHKTHTGSKPIKCKLCGKDFTSVFNLLAHTRQIHKNDISVVCEICNKKITNKIKLKIHLKSHIMVLCPICGKSISSNSRNGHMRTHQDVEYKCSICGKSFKSQKYLAIHEKYHTGEKPYQCNACDKRYKAKLNLTIHQRSHTGEKPYVCTICNQRFLTNTTLTRHMKNPSVHDKIK